MDGKDDKSDKAPTSAEGSPPEAPPTRVPGPNKPLPPESPPGTKPSVGRIVLFTVGTEDGPTKTLPAIVTAVHGDICVSLRIFLDGEKQQPERPWSYAFKPYEWKAGSALRSSVCLGTSPGQWMWPPRV